MNAQVKNALIGFFVLAAIGLSAWMLLFLEPLHGDGELTLRVRFPTIEKISIGTRVTFAGQPVGEVVAIRQLSNAREEAVDAYGHVYAYELLLQIDSSVTVYDVDDIAIHTSGLLGERSIAIIPNPSRKGKALVSVVDQVIYAHAPGTMEETINKFISLAVKAEETMEQVRSLITTNNEELFFTIQSIRKTIKNLDESINYIQDIDLLGSFKKSSEAFSGVMKGIKVQLANLEKENFFGEVTTLVRNTTEIAKIINQPETLSAIISNVHEFSERLNDWENKISNSWEDVGKVMENIVFSTENIRIITEKGKEITTDAQQIMRNISLGEGDLGKLLQREDLYFTAKAIMGKASTVMNDINHYGLLFHLDKGWQRQRTKRMNILVDLQTPTQFRNYFEEEVDQIGTSLSRVSILLEEATKKTSDADYKRGFRKGFLELLQQVENLQEVLELYNQELIETNQ